MGFIAFLVHYFTWLLGLEFLEIIISLDTFSVQSSYDELSEM